MRMLVTGANGFLGRAVVQAGLAAGHTVRALVRPTVAFESAERLEVARADLRSSTLPGELLAGVDVVLHLAAAKSGSFAEQFAGTVVATENLLRVMAPTGVALVGVSSFSVYDHRSTPAGSLIDESTPVDPAPGSRDEYARTKIVQERLFSGHRETGAKVCIARPGMIYGPGCLWHALVGIELGGSMVQVVRDAPLPLTYVENCADAIIAAAERLVAPEGGAPDVVCIVDDDLPTASRYAAALAGRAPGPRLVPVPWSVVRAGAAAIDWVNRRAFDGGLKLPGFVVPDRLDARFKPFRYSNAVARSTLGWTPRFTLDQAIERSVSQQGRGA